MWFLKPHYFCKYSIAHKYALIFTSTKPVAALSLILLCTIDLNLPILRSVERLLLSIVFQKLGLTEVMVMQGAFLLAEVKKWRRREVRSCKRARVLTTSGNEAVFTASMQYGGTSENTLRVATSWKSPGKSWIFFAVLESPWKSLNFVCKSWKVLENVYRVFPWFTRTECEVVFFHNSWYGTFWLYKAIVEIICIVKFV